MSQHDQDAALIRPSLYYKEDKDALARLLAAANREQEAREQNRRLRDACQFALDASMDDDAARLPEAIYALQNALLNAPQAATAATAASIRAALEKVLAEARKIECLFELDGMKELGAACDAARLQLDQTGGGK